VSGSERASEHRRLEADSGSDERPMSEDAAASDRAGRGSRRRDPSGWLADATARAERRFPRLGRLVIRPAVAIASRVGTDRLGVEAGSITYGAFLSIPPLLLLLVAGASLFLANSPEAQKQLLSVIQGLVPGLEEVVSSQLRIPSSGQLGVGFIGILGLIWTASGFAARARTALGVVFRLPRSGLILGRLSAGLVGVPVFVAIVALAGLSGVASGANLTGAIGIVLEALAIVALAVASVLFFAVMYWLLTPGRTLRLREHIPGAIAFGIGWAILEQVGAIYVTHLVARTSALYGTIGAIFGLLAFLYAVMWLFLLAAELSQAVREGVLHRNG
jgi:membrane protein